MMKLVCFLCTCGLRAMLLFYEAGLLAGQIKFLFDFTPFQYMVAAAFSVSS